MSRIYFHVDLNAFYANAEILLNPELKGLPLVVSGHSRRSVVSTASYEARAYGIHSAMPLQEALQLCPELVVVNHHFTWYSELSEKFIAILKQYADAYEQASIDECYLDVTTEIQKYKKPLDLAWRIQKQVLNELHLPCSIGVGPNLFLAKMASDMRKPLGITVLRIRDVEEKLWPLPIEDMRGVGIKTVPYLKDLGIQTIGDLANYTETNDLIPIFGKNTEEMIRKAHGYDTREIVEEWDPKSMGVSETMIEDMTDYDEISGLFRTLARRLSKRLYKEKKVGYTLSIRIKYFDFHNRDRSIKLDLPIWKSEDLYVHALRLFDEVWDEEPIRLLGISLSDLRERDQISSQINLFDYEASQKEETNSVLKELNRLLGSDKLIRASEAKGNHETK
ncbi:MAG: DNA polymerase IV [Solobacterium sp.]|nr:DNA polymerase IV [Solobacterium sp.]